MEVRKGENLSLEGIYSPLGQWRGWPGVRSNRIEFNCWDLVCDSEVMLSTIM